MVGKHRRRRPWRRAAGGRAPALTPWRHRLVRWGLTGALCLLAALLAGLPTGAWRIGPGSGVAATTSAGGPGTPSTASGTASGHSSAASTSSRAPTGAQSATTAGSGRTAGAADEVQRDTAIRQLLGDRARAVLTGDKPSWMRTVADAASAYGKRQSQVFDNLVRLRLGEFRYGEVRKGGALPRARRQALGPDAYLATVEGSYQLAGFDRAARAFSATLTFVREGEDWKVADDRDVPGHLQVWDLAGLRVVRTDAVLVAGNAPETALRRYAAAAEAGIERVSAVWGTGWPRRTVVLAPATSREFASLLGRSPSAALSQVAAVTQGPVADGARALADAVIVNPAAFGRLQELGQRVVITHELTHVAIRSSSEHAVPLWLSEGMADYVGYRGVSLPRRTIAKAALDQVRGGRLPDGLPDPEDYDPGETSIAPSYALSWLACARLADLYGQARLVRFYRAVASAGEADPSARAAQAFTSVFGVTEASFVRGWRDYLTRLAG